MHDIEKKKCEVINLKKQDEVNKNLIKVSESLIAMLKQLKEEPENPRSFDCSCGFGRSKRTTKG